MNIPKKRGLGSIEQSRRLQWKAVRIAFQAIEAAVKEGDREEIRKALHCFSQLNGQFVKSHGQHELQQRLETIEDHLQVNLMRKVA